MRQDRWFLALLFMVAAGLILVTRPSIHGNDGVQNYAYLRSLLCDGDLDFTNEYEHYMTLQAGWFDHKSVPRDPVTQRPINLYGVGNSILWAPYVLAAHGVAMVAGLPADGYARPYEWAVGFGSALHASAGLLLLFLLLRRRTGPEAAFWAVAVVWLASPLFFYMYLHPSMSHANSFLAAMLLLWVYLSGDGLGRWCAVGACAGLMALVRFQDAALAAAIVGAGEIVAFSQLVPGRRKPFLLGRMPRYTLSALCAVAVFSPQFMAWKALQGGYLTGPRAYMDQGNISGLPLNAMPALFSAHHGLFYWHPLLLAGAVGLVAGRGMVRERAMALVGLSAQAWIIGSWSVWWAGASFGQRMFISALPLLAIGVACAVVMVPRRRLVVPAVLIAFTLWNFGLVVQYGAAMISRKEPVTWAEMARNNFIEIPRLAWERLRGAGR